VTARQEADPEVNAHAPGVPPVQSVARAFELLEVIADSGGATNLSDLARSAGLPLGTIHRLLRTLVDLGYLRQQPSREYALGPRLIRLGETSSHLVGPWARPYLGSLVDELGETANLAMLDGDQIVYVAQVPSRHSMRMFTEVGKRVSPHCTAVGKAMLSSLPGAQVDAILRTSGMHRYTDNTITDPVSLADQLEVVRDHGYATDEGEKETGVRCVAVLVLGAPARMAMSISGPAPRMTDALVERAVPVLLSSAQALAADLTGLPGR
jgi:IclR family transcriptional regulator, acetate operon repressor